MRHRRSRVLLAEAAKLLPVAIRHAICIGREPPPQLVEHALINRNSITDRIGLGGLRCRSKHTRAVSVAAISSLSTIS